MPVRLVRPEEMRSLRQRVLRPHLRPEEVHIVGDDQPEALHVAAYEEPDPQTLLAVASACLEQAAADHQRPDLRLPDDPGVQWRVRAVASAPEVRGQGYGGLVMRALLRLIVSTCTHAPILVWLDARTSAVAFYQHLDFETRGVEFPRDNGPHLLMARRFTPETARAYLAESDIQDAVTELPPLYPLRMQPALLTKVWGGRKLETLLHKALPTDAPYGESWEMHDSATIAEGPLAGRSVGSTLMLYQRRLLGTAGDPTEGMPLLAKFLDANEWLSVQVHPDDAQAAVLEGEPRGKTEAWYVLEADPGAQLVIAVQPGTPRATLAQAIREQRLEDRLVYTEVVAGDVLLNQAGGIHALGPGVVIYEIQQSSDVTYRLYDWGRMDLNGQPRALHIEKGLEVANTSAIPPITHTAQDKGPVVEVCDCDYFQTRLHQLEPGAARSLDLGGVFHILTCIGGSVNVRAESGTALGATTLRMGETALVPAECASVQLTALEAPARVLDSSEPVR